MIEVKLKRKAVGVNQKETIADGVHDVVRFVLAGTDKDNEVDWNVTLTHKGTELPKDYRKVLGKHWRDEVFGNLTSGAQQTEL